MTITIKPIRTEQDHATALARIDALFDAKPGTPAFDELDVIATLIDAYESAHWPIDPPSPVAAIKFRIEQGQFTRKELVAILGSAKTSEVLTLKRDLSKVMIVRLHNKFDIPYESLLSDVEHRLDDDLRLSRRAAKSKRSTKSKQPRVRHASASDR